MGFESGPECFSSERFSSPPVAFVTPTLVALLAAGGLVLFGAGQAPPAFGQSPGMEYPSGSPYGNYNSNHRYVPGQQIVPGSSVAPKQASRPAGWPGGPGDDPPPPVRRRSYAAPFKSNGTAATALPAGRSGRGRRSAQAHRCAAERPATHEYADSWHATGGRSKGAWAAAHEAIAARATRNAADRDAAAGRRADGRGVWSCHAIAGSTNSGLGGRSGTRDRQHKPRPVSNNFGHAPATQTFLRRRRPTRIPAAAAVSTRMPVGRLDAGWMHCRTGRQAAMRRLPDAMPPANCMQTASAAQPVAAIPCRGRTGGSGDSGGRRRGERWSKGCAEQPKRQAVPFGLPPTFSGAEIIAWVGPEPILASDVLPDANRTLARIAERAPHARPQQMNSRMPRKMYMSKFLDRLIRDEIAITEARRSIRKEAWPKIEKQFNEQFDKEYRLKMLETEECRLKNRARLPKSAKPAQLA